MKIKICFLVVLSFAYLAPLIAQKSNLGSINKNQLGKAPIFSLKDYKINCDTKSDTTWLPQRQDRYRWNGEELAKIDTYELLFYNSPDELATLIIVDSNTDDSLLMASYGYDEHSRVSSEVYRTYNSSKPGWDIEYKALHSYDSFGSRSKTLIQGWDGETASWHDSIADVVINVDTNEAIEYYIEEYINEEWMTIFGYQWVYNYTPERHIDSQCNFILDAETGEYVNDVRAHYLLNVDGSWYEAEWQVWDKEAGEWNNTQKYSDVVWEVFNKYPQNYKNKVKSRFFEWWIGDDWFTYLRDNWEFPTPGLDDVNMEAFSFSEEANQWYRSRIYTARHYPNNWKRRYTDSIKNGINEPWLLNYDDSVRWYFYKGALEEMYRVNYDTARKEWLPAARMVYSDFTYFVDDTGLEENTGQKDTGLTIIPNPSKNNIEIINKHQFEIISVFDGNGKLLINVEKQENIPRIKIDISKLAKGTYFVKAINTEKRAYTDKLIVN